MGDSGDAAHSVVFGQDEAGLRASLEYVKDGIFFADSRGVIVDVNAAACTQLGRSRSEVVGSSVATFAGRKHFQFSSIVNRLETEPHLSYQTTHLNSSGARVDIDLTITRMPTQGSFLYMGIARDVTERAHVEEELRQSERRYRLLVENLPDLVARLDREQRYVYINPVFEAATGISLQVALGKSNAELACATGEARLKSDSSKGDGREEKMSEPIPAQKAPYNITVEQGKRYFWCACGRSTSFPAWKGCSSVSRGPMARSSTSAWGLRPCRSECATAFPACGPSGSTPWSRRWSKPAGISRRLSSQTEST